MPEWAGIEPESAIAGLTGPLFAYFKPPVSNRIEPESKMGVSIYSGEVAELIRQADEQWALLKWEYQSGRRKIYVDGIRPDDFKSRIVRPVGVPHEVVQRG